MVPLRGVLETMGASIDWMQDSQTVVATRGNIEIDLPIGSRTATINGREVTLDVPAMTIAGRTMVPLRFVSETLGAQVEWNDRTRTVSIDTPDRPSARVAAREGGDTHRTAKPHIDGITHNLGNHVLRAGEAFHIVVRGTPGGQAWFRIRMSVGDMKIGETSPGVYEGTWHNNTGHDIKVDDHDVLAF